jgi:tetratricopeptide (TPR) repeat protein
MIMKHHSLRASHTSRAALARALALCLLAPALLVQVACNQPKKPPVFDLGTSPDPEIFRRALDLAMRADALRKRGQYEQAAELYRQSLELKNDIGAVWVNYGVCLMEIGDMLPARDAFIRAGDLIPSDPTPYENLGTLYLNRGHAEKALEFYSVSLERDPYWLPSLRGAIIATRNLRAGSPVALERIERAILVEKDPKFLFMMQNERTRVQAVIRDRGHPVE